HSNPAHQQAFRQVDQFWIASVDLPQMPMTAKALKGEGQTRVQRYMFRNLAFAASILVAVTLLWIVNYHDSNLTVHHATAVGEQKTVQLDDGSMMTLNTRTSVEIDFNRDRRRVIVTRGQAVFDVAADSQRPFQVVTEHAQVDVLGTRLDVYRQPE